MQKYVLSQNKNSNVEDFQMREQLIATFINRFSTYGYKQVRTSTFEQYDLYSNITGTVNKDEMIKVIDTSGKVLVLRPDVTIPLARMNTATTNQRLFYVLDVFRQSIEQIDQKESTQAGVELFGDRSPEADAEVIVLAIHTLKDLGFKNFKIELGHAGFFKELIQQADLNQTQFETLQTYIHSKNLVEIEPFLKGLGLADDLRNAIQLIPMMYGNPADVINEARKIIRNASMQQVLQNIIDVYDVLEDYGVADSIVLNLGLINNMDYYSGIIFQGFLDSIGKPVLMGGRYDHLGKQFGDATPAIGFAFEVDYLVHALQQQGKAIVEIGPDFIIKYDKTKQKAALQTAYRLRNEGLQVLTYLIEDADTNSAKTAIVNYTEAEQQLITEKESYAFASADDLVSKCLTIKEGK
ncbi:ATP phosphoribosyltransferase regulatory subunit [Oceanobacillus sp. 143]|uniref:ATP phosphoribosyltransferase regulatory subunit n=1 Tax=Oceanobacillus zhaokaii TaxID=2052660 RepID=A0A345PD87_9BACI|nr:ATP phosphoribosyltransferase regulatory subunit [Oceanobacillus zhaokaii]AXI07967.1 ATP phosphoribosyltransferase regulatory subunit [Oceanobacillus zhaokaii]QGS68007.1 ATP phosphoribosyltransferase regulatory subunit [Oceanobacillus sp. 143]